MKASAKKAGAGRILLRILGIFLAVILLAAAVLFVIPLTETVKIRTLEDSSDWMAKLDDSLRLNEIVLPGTHDSATQYCQLAFITKCQALSIGEQLEAGFRYLDIRLGSESEALRLKHGFTNCKTGPMPWAEPLLLEEVLKQCYAFLRAHPSETVVFAAKHEYGGMTDSVLAQTLEGQISRNAELWYTGDQLPSLGEVRGKLVLMRRYRDEAGFGAKAGIPMLWTDQDEKEIVSGYAEKIQQSTYLLRVQDRFCLGTENKWDCFRGGILDAEADPESLSIHFLSTKGTWKYGHPYHYAKNLNSRLLELPSEELRGWIIVDFADAELAKHIWSANFK